MTSEPHASREPTIFNSIVTCLFVAIILFIALLYRQNNLVLLALLVLSVMSGAKVWSRFSPSRITCAINVDKRRAFPGETIALEASLENAKFLPVWLRLLWPIEGALKPVGGDEHIFKQESGLLGYQRMQLHWHLVARRRGVHRVGPPRILSSDPLGFFEKEKRTADPIHIIVYPKLIPLKPVSLPQRDLFGVPGVKSPVNDPIYILGTRDYQPVRPSRYIHWKASARCLRLQEKVFEPSQQEKVLLALEVGAFEEREEKEAFEDSLEVIASLAVQLDNMGYAVGLATNGVLTDSGSCVVPIARGPRQLPTILETLARMQMTQNGTIEEILRDSIKALRQVSFVYFSYSAGKAAEKTAKYCRKHNVEMTFFVYHLLPESKTFKKKGGASMHTINDIRVQRR